MKLLKKLAVVGCFSIALWTYAGKIEKLETAAAQGTIRAHLALGKIYEHGETGIPQDVGKAVVHYQKAFSGGIHEGLESLTAMAQRGIAKAQSALGAIYQAAMSFNGPLALQWVQRAAENGEAESQYQWGRVWEEGLYGHAKEPLQACIWYRQAADKGILGAVEKLKKLIEFHIKVESKPSNMTVSLFDKVGESSKLLDSYEFSINSNRIQLETHRGHWFQDVEFTDKRFRFVLDNLQVDVTPDGLLHLAGNYTGERNLFLESNNGIEVFNVSRLSKGCRIKAENFLNIGTLECEDLVLELSEGASNAGSLNVQTSIEINPSATFSNEGTLCCGSKLILTGGQEWKNHGTLEAQGLVCTTKMFTGKTGGQILAQKDLTLKCETFENDGTLSAESLMLQAESLRLLDKSSIQVKTADINFSYPGANAGLLSAETLNLKCQGGQNALANDGHMDVKTLSLESGVLANHKHLVVQDALIIRKNGCLSNLQPGELDIRAQTVENDGSLYNESTFRNVVGRWNNSGELSSLVPISINGSIVHNTGRFGGDVSVKASDTLILGGSYNTDKKVKLEGQTIRVHSDISGNGDLSFSGKTLEFRNGALACKRLTLSDYQRAEIGDTFRCFGQEALTFKGQYTLCLGVAESAGRLSVENFSETDVFENSGTLNALVLSIGPIKFFRNQKAFLAKNATSEAKQFICSKDSKIYAENIVFRKGSFSNFGQISGRVDFEVDESFQQSGPIYAAHETSIHTKGDIVLKQPILGEGDLTLISENGTVRFEYPKAIQIQGSLTIQTAKAIAVPANCEICARSQNIVVKGDCILGQNSCLRTVEGDSQLSVEGVLDNNGGRIFWGEGQHRIEAKGNIRNHDKGSLYTTGSFTFCTPQNFINEDGFISAQRGLSYEVGQTLENCIGYIDCDGSASFKAGRILNRRKDYVPGTYSSSGIFGGSSGCSAYHYFLDNPYGVYGDYVKSAKQASCIYIGGNLTLDAALIENRSSNFCVTGQINFRCNRIENKAISVPYQYHWGSRRHTLFGNETDIHYGTRYITVPSYIVCGQSMVGLVGGSSVNLSHIEYKANVSSAFLNTGCIRAGDVNIRGQNKASFINGLKDCNAPEINIVVETPRPLTVQEILQTLLQFGLATHKPHSGYRYIPPPDLAYDGQKELSRIRSFGALTQLKAGESVQFLMQNALFPSFLNMVCVKKYGTTLAGITGEEDQNRYEVTIKLLERGKKALQKAENQEASLQLCYRPETNDWQTVHAPDLMALSGGDLDLMPRELVQGRLPQGFKDPIIVLNLWDQEKPVLYPQLFIPQNYVQRLEMQSRNFIQARRHFTAIDFDRFENVGTILAGGNLHVKARVFENTRDVFEQTVSVKGGWFRGSKEYIIRTPKKYSGNIVGLDVVIETSGQLRNTGGKILGLQTVYLVSQEGNIENRYQVGTHLVSWDPGFWGSVFGSERASLATTYYPGEVVSGRDVDIKADDGYILLLASKILAEKNITLRSGRGIQIEDRYAKHVAQDDVHSHGLALVRETREVDVHEPSQLLSHDGIISLETPGAMRIRGSEIQAPMVNLLARGGNELCAGRQVLQASSSSSGIHGLSLGQNRTSLMQEAIYPTHIVGDVVRIESDLDNTLEAAFIHGNELIHVVAGRNNIFKGTSQSTRVDSQGWGLGISFFGSEAIQRGKMSAIVQELKDESLVQALRTLAASRDGQDALGNTVQMAVEVVSALQQYAQCATPQAFIGNRLGITDELGRFSPRLTLHFTQQRFQETVERCISGKLTAQNIRVESTGDTRLLGGQKLLAEQSLLVSTGQDLMAEAGKTTQRSETRSASVGIAFTPLTTGSGLINPGVSVENGSSESVLHEPEEVCAPKIELNVGGKLSGKGLFLAGKTVKISAKDSVSLAAISDTHSAHSSGFSIGIQKTPSGTQPATGVHSSRIDFSTVVDNGVNAEDLLTVKTSSLVLTGSDLFSKGRMELETQSFVYHDVLETESGEKIAFTFRMPNKNAALSAPMDFNSEDRSLQILRRATVSAPDIVSSVPLGGVNRDLAKKRQVVHEDSTHVRFVTPVFNKAAYAKVTNALMDRLAEQFRMTGLPVRRSVEAQLIEKEEWQKKLREERHAVLYTMTDEEIQRHFEDESLNAQPWVQTFEVNNGEEQLVYKIYGFTKALPVAYERAERDLLYDIAQNAPLLACNNQIAAVSLIQKRMGKIEQDTNATKSFSDSFLAYMQQAQLEDSLGDIRDSMYAPQYANGLLRGGKEILRCFFMPINLGFTVQEYLAGEAAGWHVGLAALPFIPKPTRQIAKIERPLERTVQVLSKEERVALCTQWETLTPQQKGILGEMALDPLFQRLQQSGFEKLPCKLPGNHGFDHVWVHYNQTGGVEQIIVNKVFVIESKASATGRFQLGTSYVEQEGRKVKVKQMSSQWIDKNIDLMVGSLDPQIKATGKLLQKNKTLIQPKASVLTPDGTVRFGKPTKSLPPFNSTE